MFSQNNPYMPPQQQGNQPDNQQIVNNPDPNSPNYGQLQSIMPPKQGVIAQGQLPQGGGGSGGIGDLLSGLSGLIGKGKSDLGIGPKTDPIIPSSPGGSTTNYVRTAVTGQGQPLTSDSRLSQIVGNSDIFKNAMAELGQRSDSPALQAYLAKANPNLDPSQTPWCAGFVGSVLNASGLKGTGSLAAKSYLNYGQPTNNPQRGDIVVFNDLTGQNRPEHGHVGFVDHIDPNTGKVIVLGGNQDNSVSLKAYPMNMVAGFRVPPSGQQIKQIATQNGLTNPKQLTQLTSNSASQPFQPRYSTTNMTETNPNQVPTSAIDLIKRREDFISKPTWDVNAYRAGYGSDTTTLANGQIVKIRPGMNVSKEDAERDIQRRSQEFYQHAGSQVGVDIWTNLPEPARAALTSMTYNYGSLPSDVVRAAKTGDINEISQAVSSHAKDNHGINAERRHEEAQMIENSMKSTLNDYQPIVPGFEQLPRTTSEGVKYNPPQQPIIPNEANEA